MTFWVASVERILFCMFLFAFPPPSKAVCCHDFWFPFHPTFRLLPQWSQPFPQPGLKTNLLLFTFLLPQQQTCTLSGSYSWKISYSISRHFGTVLVVGPGMCQNSIQVPSLTPSVFNLIPHAPKLSIIESICAQSNQVKLGFHPVFQISMNFTKVAFAGSFETLCR